MNLLCQVTLIDPFAQQFAGDIPSLVTRQRAVDCHHQLISLLKLAVRGLRHAHFLLKREHFFSRFQLFRLEGFQPFGGAVGG
ncbi:Uncharacterised protein [Shigella sonnei]|nr:Uncharacterised protein [Shigella sonnei]CSS65384.1 Uncharacterised protein [Shigella sonnei]